MRTWQPLYFFEHACYLLCQCPGSRPVMAESRRCPRPGRGFTLLFEALALALLAREMPVKRGPEMLCDTPQRVWSVLNHWVCEARKRDDLSTVTRLGFDETCSRKGHEYITRGGVKVTKRLLHTEPGKGADAIVGIQRYLISQEVKP